MFLKARKCIQKFYTFYKKLVFPTWYQARSHMAKISQMAIFHGNFWQTESSGCPNNYNTVVFLNSTNSSIRSLKSEFGIYCRCKLSLWIFLPFHLMPAWYYKKTGGHTRIFLILASIDHFWSISIETKVKSHGNSFWELLSSRLHVLVTHVANP